MHPRWRAILNEVPRLCLLGLFYRGLAGWLVDDDTTIPSSRSTLDFIMADQKRARRALESRWIENVRNKEFRISTQTHTFLSCGLSRTFVLGRVGVILTFRWADKIHSWCVFDRIPRG